MKLVIDIPKKVYDHIRKNVNIVNGYRLTVADAIYYGKKLEEYLNESNSDNPRR